MTNFDLKPIPNKPGIYVMHDEGGVAYVGQSGTLRERIRQHLIKRESSVTVVSAPVMLNPDKVTHVHYWWRHESLPDKKKRKGAEFVAACVLKPSLRSRDRISDKEVRNILKDQKFCHDMDRLFRGDPDGVYQHPTVDTLTDMVSKLYKRVSELEAQLKEKEN